MTVANILLTIDVEDWFHVENFRTWIPFSSWHSRELRVEKNTHHLLDLFDSIDLKRPSILASQPQAQRHLKATFFILGWLAERLPNLVREIHTRGHEVASHGYYHNLCYQLPHEDLVKDLTDSKKLLEDIIGAPVFGYRAPNFSISDDALRIVQDCGYRYDSSYNSFGLHSRYGKVELPANGKMGIAIPNPTSTSQKPASSTQHPAPSNQPPSFYELPISNLKLGNPIFPWGGGGYFRLIPFSVFRAGIRHILNAENAYVLYLHPWEIDPGQPKVKEARDFLKFRHYINLAKTYSRLSKLIQDLTHHQFVTCSRYLDLMEARMTEMNKQYMELNEEKP